MTVTPKAKVPRQHLRCLPSPDVVSIVLRHYLLHLCRDVGLDVLQSNLGHCHIQPSHLVRVAEGCQQQPCLVRIAGRALAQGCIAPQDIISHAPGELCCQETDPVVAASNNM